MERNRREEAAPEGQSKQHEARMGKTPSEPGGMDWLGLLLARGDGRGLAPSAPRVPPSLLPGLLTGCRAIDTICLCPRGILVMEDASINTRGSSKCLKRKKKKNQEGLGG